MNLESNPHKIALSLVLKRDNLILMGRRCNTGHQDGNYSLISGHLENNESLKEGILREAKEEIGIDIHKENLSIVHVHHRKNDKNSNPYIDIFFMAETWSGEIENMEPHKCDDVSWFDINDLPENIPNYIQIGLENIKHNVMYSEIDWK